jgi:hypothetical protein
MTLGSTSFRATPVLLATFLVTACKDKGGDSNSAPPIDTEPTGDSGDTCVGGTAPTISKGPICGYPGMQVYETDEVPTLSFTLTASDDDWDLDVYELTLWYDDVADGSLDTSTATELSGSPHTENQDDCVTPTISLTQTLFVPPDSLDYDTLYDWGLAVTDSHGLQSAVSVVTCATPTSDGSAGTGR